MSAPTLMQKQIACALLQAAKVLSRQIKEVDPNSLVSYAYDKIQNMSSVVEEDIAWYVRTVLRNCCIDELRRQQRMNRHLNSYVNSNVIIFDESPENIHQYTDNDNYGSDISLSSVCMHMIERNDTDAIRVINLIQECPDLISSGKYCRFRVRAMCDQLGWDIHKTNRTVKRITRVAKSLRERSINKVKA